MLPKIPAKTMGKLRDESFGFIGLDVWGKNLNASNDFDNLDNDEGKENDGKADESGGDGFLRLLGLFWVILACADYII